MYFQILCSPEEAVGGGSGIPLISCLRVSTSQRPFAQPSQGGCHGLELAYWHCKTITLQRTRKREASDDHEEKLESPMPWEVEQARRCKMGCCGAALRFAGEESGGTIRRAWASRSQNCEEGELSNPQRWIHSRVYKVEASYVHC